MKKEENSRLFEVFWENSKIHRFNVKELGKRFSEYGRYKELAPQLFYQGEEIKLSKKNDRLSKIFNSRISTRKFIDKPLDKKYLNSLFQAFVSLENGRRTLPSAGARYPIEVYALFYNVKDTENAVYYYNQDRHSLSFVKKIEEWKKTSHIYNLAIDGTPAIVFIFVGFSERVTKKYGERGGRFMLIEAGHYAQNLGLRLGVDNLGGVEVGGIMDDEMKELLGLKTTEAKIVLGFAVGNK